MKKILFFAIVLVLTLSALVISASAATTTVESKNFQGGVRYKSTTNEFGTVNYAVEGAVINNDSYLDATARVVMKNGDNTYSTYPTRYLMKGYDWAGPYWDYERLSTLAGETYTSASVIRIEFPEGATAVRGSSFANNTELVYVRVASTVTTLRGNCFQGCSSLATVEFAYNYEAYPEFGSALTEIGNGSVFASCTSLTKLVFPNSLLTTHNGVFSGCSALKELNLGASYQSCGQVAGTPANLEKYVLSTTYIPGGTRYNYDDLKKPAFGTKLVIYYTGDYDQAVALQTNETRLYEIKYGTLVSYDVFTSDTFVRDETVHYFVYGYNACDAFYNSNHNYEGTGNCLDGVECTQCHDEIASFAQHNMVETLVYGSFMQAGVYNKYCSNASDCAVGKIANQEAPAIFTMNEFNGFSESGKDGIAFGGFQLNAAALDEYNRVNSEATVKYGVVLINPDYLDGKDSFFKDGKVNSTVENKGFVQTDMSGARYANISISVTGFSGKAENLSLILAIYAYTDANDVEFIQSGTTKCGSAKVTIGAQSLYTVTYASVKAGNSTLANLGEYVMPSQKEQQA